MSAHQRIPNLYWEEVKQILANPPTSSREIRHLRALYCQQYCWSLPDPATLDFVRTWLQPRAVEMGAGTGYWSALLSQLGVHMEAFDRDPPHLSTTNRFHSPRNPFTGNFLHQARETYFPIAWGTPDILALPRYWHHTLFLSWPPHLDQMAVDCLRWFGGTRLVYIGYPRGGILRDQRLLRHTGEGMASSRPPRSPALARHLR